MGRGRALLSALPRGMMSELDNPIVMKFMAKHKMMSVIHRSLLTLVAVADDAEAKFFATVGSSSCNVVEWLCHFDDVMYHLYEVLRKTADADAKPALDFILQRFEIITKQKHLLFLTEKLQGEQEHRSSHKKVNVYGRDKEKDEMIDFLLSDQASGSVGNTAVIAIVGVAGIGKTTLGDLVYHDDRVKAYFELQGWVDFEEELDAEGLAKIILDSFNEDFHLSDGLTELIGRLGKCLDGKKFLLVLDGFRNLTGWEALRTCFADAAGKGSAVILTTQRVEVALKMRSDHVLHLGLLSLEDSCSLFSEHAFGDLEGSHAELVSVAKHIVRKLGGLPLAAKRLGSVLYHHQDFHAWTELLKVKRSDLLELSLPLQFSEPCLYHFDNLVHLEIVGAWGLKLPDEIGELRCLEYLDLSFSGICTWPNSMSLLSRLHTLKLSFIRYLRKLPSSLVDLDNLHYLDIRGTSRLGMSIPLGRLKNLQTLVGFVVNKYSGSNLTQLASFSNIQTLSITELQNMVDATCASKANLKGKRCLQNLTLRWNQLSVPELERAPEYLKPSEQPKMLEILGVPESEQALKHLEPPKQLKMLEILGCPVRRLPNWLGDASFGTLEVLHIRDCRNCNFLPPLGQLSSLKELSIQGCDNVRSVGNEFNGETTSNVPFKSLEILWFVDMPNWKEWITLDAESLPFPCLRELYLIHCPELLQDLPKHLPSLKKLEIFQCGRLVAPGPKIPDNHESVVQEQDCADIVATSAAEVTSGSSSYHDKFGMVVDPVINRKNDESILDDDDDDDRDGGTLDFESSFEIVKVADASELCQLPDILRSLRIEGCQFLESLPNQFLKDCSDIFELFFIDCCSLKHFADVLHPNSLRTLHIRKCPVLEFIIPLGTHKKFELLEHLCISSSCESLASISINLFPKLRTLYIKDCPNLESFSMAEGLRLRDRNLKLESLEIRDCPNLTSFPERGLPTPNLKTISISNCRSLKSLPNHFATLTSLQSLLIDRCPELESFPDGGLPSSLSLLSIAFSDKLAPQKQWKLHTLRSLTHFEIESGCVGMKSFPDKDLLPRNLKSLRISRLSSLRVLNGMGLQHLTALETLEINCCHGLFSLPEGFPSSLTCLCIKECSILTQKLSYKAGTEWSQIAHIPNLQIDNGAVHGVEKETPAKEVPAASS